MLGQDNGCNSFRCHSPFWSDVRTTRMYTHPRHDTPTPRPSTTLGPLSSDSTLLSPGLSLQVSVPRHKWERCRRWCGVKVKGPLDIPRNHGDSLPSGVFSQAVFFSGKFEILSSLFPPSGGVLRIQVVPVSRRSVSDVRYVSQDTPSSDHLSRPRLLPGHWVREDGPHCLSATDRS